MSAEFEGHYARNDKEEVIAERDEQLAKEENENFQKELDAEAKEERNRESVMTKYDCWKSDNIIDLRKEFFNEQKKANKDAFPDYAEPKDVEEYYPDEFSEYCKEQYELFKD